MRAAFLVFGLIGRLVAVDGFEGDHLRRPFTSNGIRATPIGGVIRLVSANLRAIPGGNPTWVGIPLAADEQIAAPRLMITAGR